MAPLSLRSVGTWFNHCTLQRHKLKYKDTFVNLLEPYEGYNFMSLLLRELDFTDVTKMSSQVNSLWDSSHWRDCAAFIFGTSFAFYISSWTYLRPSYHPPKIFQKCSCKVPPPPIHATSCWHLMHRLWKNIQQFVLGRKLRCCFVLIKWVKEKLSVVYFK